MNNMKKVAARHHKKTKASSRLSARPAARSSSSRTRSLVMTDHECTCITSPTQYTLLTISIWSLFSFMLLLSWSMFSNLIVLGTDKVPALLAASGVGLALTLGAVLTTTLVHRAAHHTQSPLRDLHQLWFSFVTMSVMLWLLARFAVVFGVGVDGWYVVVFEGIVLAVIHLLVTKIISMMR
jgi:hypothetical protein